MFKTRPTFQVAPEPSSYPENHNRIGYPDKVLTSATTTLPSELCGGLWAVRSRAFLDIAQPPREAPSGKQRHEFDISNRKCQSTFIDVMIGENGDLWGQLMNHPFCIRMGDGTARIEGFKDYAINEFIFLRNYVPFKLGVYSKTDDWEVLSTEAPTSIVEQIKFANLQLRICVQELSIPEAKVLKAEPMPNVKAYIGWVNDLIQTEDWFSLHVLMAPCILGYFDIATKLFNDPSTKKGTIFHKLWIEPNARDPITVENAQKFRAWFDANMEHTPPRPSDLKHWRCLFRKACEMEISFFDTGL